MVAALCGTTEEFAVLPRAGYSLDPLFMRKPPMSTPTEEVRSSGSQYEDVEGWQPLDGAANRVEDTDLDGPDHPDYPLASDDLEEAPKVFAPCGEENRAFADRRRTSAFRKQVVRSCPVTKSSSRY